MFTEGQIQRMIGALQLQSRSPLWQENNLIKVGLQEPNSVNSFVNEILIYPNPIINSEFQISILNNNLKILEISILDAFGRQIQSIDKLTYRNNIVLNNISDGFYFLRLSTNKGLISKKTISKY